MWGSLRRRGAPTGVAALTVLGSLLLGASGSSAGQNLPAVSCSLGQVAPNGLLIIARTDGVRIRRAGDEIRVLRVRDSGRRTPVSCSGGTPTVLNTDTIELLGLDPDTAETTISLAGGGFEPGATPEADGSSEIEIFLRLESSLPVLQGGRQDDSIRLGMAGRRMAANLNPDADGASPDRDLTVTAGFLPIFFLTTGEGDDRVDTRGGAGFSGPFAGFAAVLLGPGADVGINGHGTGGDLFFPLGAVFLGGPGPDRLLGGHGVDAFVGGPGADLIRGRGGSDLLRGGDGRDRIHGGGGADSVEAAGGGRDRVLCGRGRDQAKLDRSDGQRDCELVVRRGSKRR